MQNVIIYILCIAALSGCVPEDHEICENYIVPSQLFDIYEKKAKHDLSDIIVIFVHGSGALDHNSRFSFSTADTCHFQEYLNTDIFLFTEVSDYFCRNGISSISYDKISYRNSDYYEKTNSTPLDFINDLDIVFETIKNDSTLREKRLFLLGHSQGANIALEYLKANENLTGIIAVNGLGMNPASHFASQVYKTVSDCEHNNSKANDYKEQLLKELNDLSVENSLDTGLITLQYRTESVNGWSSSYYNFGFRHFWKDLLMIFANTVQKYSSTKRPVLIVHGQDDINVPYTHFEYLKNTITAPNVHFIGSPNTDHFLRTNKGELNVDLMSEITNWLLSVPTTNTIEDEDH